MAPPDPAEAVSARRLFKVLIFSTIVFQRFGLPFAGGQIPIVLPIIIVVVLAAVQRGDLREDPLRLQLYLLTLIWCAAMAAVSSWRGLAWSPLSIGYLAVTYLPFAFHLREPSREAYRAGLIFFLRIVTVAAWVGIGQMIAQALGWTYRDLLDPVPGAFVIQGFNTSYPIFYGSGIFKANGVLFLEPSIYSQFLALALVVHLHLRRRGRGMYPYVAALAASVSGTGLILAGAGVLALAVSRRDKELVRLIVALLAAGLAIGLSPVGSLFASRLDRSAGGVESAQGRFIAPYQLTVSMFTEDPASVLAGRGPGSAERLSERVTRATGITAVFPVIPKLAYEYGLLAAALFGCYVLTCALGDVPSSALSVTVLVFYLTLSGSLLQPTTVYVLYVFTTLFSGVERSSQSRPTLVG